MEYPNSKASSNRLDTTLFANNLLFVSKDRLTVTHKGSSQRENNVGAIKSEKPVPLDRSIYYYEVKVLNSGEKNCITVGFTSRDFKLQNQPGWDPNSFGFRGDDGCKYSGTTSGSEFGPKFGANDVIGAGIHLERGEIFFTKNRKFMKVAFTNVKGELYPAVGLASKGERVEMNFGQRPFVFDLEGMVQEEKTKLQNEIRRHTISSMAANDVVRNYLLHYGYVSTLRAFDEFIGRTSNSPPESSQYLSSLELRQWTRECIAKGDVDAVMGTLSSEFPSWESRSDSWRDVQFALLCQKFVELVRRRDIESAINFAQKELYPFRDASIEYGIKLAEIIPAVAYENPQDSELEYLFSKQRKEEVADIVNRAILLSYSEKEDGARQSRSMSSMEKLLRQLVAAHHQMRDENQSQGEVFLLHDHML